MKVLSPLSARHSLLNNGCTMRLPLHTTANDLWADKLDLAKLFPECFLFRRFLSQTENISGPHWSPGLRDRQLLSSFTPWTVLKPMAKSRPASFNQLSSSFFP